MRKVACGIALLLVAVGLLRAEGAFFAAALPFAAFAALGVFMGPPEPDLAAERSLSSRFAPVGSRIEVVVHVTNRGGRLEALRLRDILPEGLVIVEGEAAWSGSLSAGGEITLRYVVECARGAFTLDRLEAVAEDPLTTLRTDVRIPGAATLAIHPRTFTPPGIVFGAGAARPFSGRSRAKRMGTGTDFAGTRDYAPGDPLKCLNWRAEALWGRPIVNVFEEERAIDAGIILDCRSQAYDRIEVFEAAVTAALSMAEDLLDRGDRVAFLSYGSLISWTPPGSGREHRARLRMAAARAALGAHAAFDRFDNLPPHIFPPHSLVLLVSPLVREDAAPLRSLRALEYEVAVLRPEPTSFQAAENDLAERLLALERQALLTRLLQAGIAVLDWDASRPLASLRALGGGRP